MALFKIDAENIAASGIDEVRKKGEEITFSSNNRRLEAGVYITDEPIIVEVGDFRGAGSDKTLIIADFPEKDKPIIFAGSTPFIGGFTICYKDGLVDGNEKDGERVGISTINYWPLQKGACIRDVGIKNVGTGVCSSGSYDGKANHAFSVMFDRITVTDFSFRGFDFNSTVRTGNVYSKIRLSSGKYKCETAFYFGYDTSEKEESESDISSLTVYDTVAKTPIVMGGARALCAGEITLDNVTAEDGVFMLWERSSGKIDRLCLKNSRLPQDGILMKIGDSHFLSFETLNYCNIDKLLLENVSGDTQGFRLFTRSDEHTCPFYIKVDGYEVSGQSALENFPVSDNLTFIKKGTPVNESRLCPFYSKKYGDDGSVLIWTGTDWK